MGKTTIGSRSDSKISNENVALPYDPKLVNKENCLNVLHVDDDLSSLEVSKEILELKGNLRVDIATSVDEALRKMETKCYDAIVSDYKMPGKNGLDFLKEVCRLGLTTSFILFSAKGDEKVASVAYNLGAFRYVNKCGDPETVYNELSNTIFEAFKQAQNEEKFLETEEQLKQLLLNMPIGVTVYAAIDHGEDFIIEYLNNAAEKIGKTSKGKRLSKEFPSMKDSGLFKAIQRVWQTEQPEYFQAEILQDNKNQGNWREYWVYRLPNGNITAVFNYIHENKKGETKRPK